MNRKSITALALASGFKLKTQPDGAEALNSYVFTFAYDLLAAHLTGHPETDHWITEYTHARQAEMALRAENERLKSDLLAARQPAQPADVTLEGRRQPITRESAKADGFDLDKMIVQDGDHGGYKSGYCLLCGQHGWINAGGGIQHLRFCIVGEAPGTAAPSDISERIDSTPSTPGSSGSLSDRMD